MIEALIAAWRRRRWRRNGGRLTFKQWYKRQPSTAVESAKSATPPPTASPVSREDFSDLFNADGSLKRMPPGTKVRSYWGYLQQHLQNGDLLVKAGDKETRMMGLFALVSGGVGNNLPDGAEINFNAIPSGVHSYVTTSGAMSTIPQLLYIPPEAMPKAKPGAWMWQQHGNPLETRY